MLGNSLIDFTADLELRSFALKFASKASPEMSLKVEYAGATLL